jgi:hypothetical protein
MINAALNEGNRAQNPGNKLSLFNIHTVTKKVITPIADKS